MTPSPVGMRCPECARQRTQVTTAEAVRTGGAEQPIVTYALIAICVVAFIGEMAGGAGLGFGRAGGTFVEKGALFGPSQVAARLCEFIFAGNAHPLNLARAAFSLIVCAFAVLALAGIAAPVAAAFAIMFGIANGLVTIARGTVPLALFGPTGYGRIVGRIAGPSLLIQAAAPFLLAYVAEHASDRAALAVAAAFALVALACFAAVRRPG